MTKKQTHKTKQEVQVEFDEQAEQKIDAACATELEATMKKYNRALQPFIQRTDVADLARVRLVRVKPENAEQQDVQA